MKDERLRKVIRLSLYLPVHEATNGVKLAYSRHHAMMFAPLALGRYQTLKDSKRQDDLFANDLTRQQSRAGDHGQSYGSTWLASPGSTTTNGVLSGRQNAESWSPSQAYSITGAAIFNEQVNPTTIDYAAPPAHTSLSRSYKSDMDMLPDSYGRPPVSDAASSAEKSISDPTGWLIPQ